ncbi:MAG TPA: zinc-dependent metalloprotease [Actinomycetes bacterium]|nr:zinc-dependent metalloprotease [Actinomycetes bacterium]
MGAAVATTLDPPPTTASELVDWRLASRVGRRVAGGDPLLVRPAWSGQFTELSTRADLAVAEYTGLGGQLGPPVAEPMDRGQWIDANLAILRRVLRPVAEKVAKRRSWTSVGPMPALARTSTQVLTGLQAGTLLGYVGQRVLGQYDLPVPNPDAPELEGTVYYVVPNIVAVEQRHGFRPLDFRLWIAVHETAHRRQFRGVAWLSGHIQGLLDEFLASVDLDEEAIRRMGRRAQALTRKLVAGEAIDLMDFLVTAEQRQIVDRMQATMSVLEGHGEFVMQGVGERLVPGHDRMHRVLHERRLAPRRADRVLQQVLGLRQKLDQYALGEAFVRRLHDHGGMALVNRVFEGPEALPTLGEVQEPDRWLARVG